MKLEDAIPKIEKFIGIKFKDIYTIDELRDIKIAKGNTGKLLEKIIGLPAGNTLRDFENGELKTNKCNETGKPLETMFISQISNRFDELLDESLKFKDSWIYEKIQRLLYVPVVKTDEDPDNWYFLKTVFIDISQNEDLYNQLKSDFEQIKQKVTEDVNSGDNFIHTSSGKYIQIRTKDAKPYNPIFSNRLNREVSNKNFAFYFKKDFMKKVNPITNE
jgi:DNA mismatch repair protein MutH